MLCLTDNAVATIRELTSRREAAEGAGVRIAADRASRTLRFTLESEPHDGDEVFNTGGVRLFLGAEATQLLDNQVLDAAVGADDGVRFALTRQSA